MKFIIETTKYSKILLIPKPLTEIERHLFALIESSLALSIINNLTLQEVLPVKM